MSKIRSFFRVLPDILYPRRCALCDNVLRYSEKYVCENCIEKVTFIKGKTCIKCGKPVKSRHEVLCADCFASKRLFDEAFMPFTYSGLIRDSIVRFKYYGRAEYAAFYSRCIYSFGKTYLKRWNADVIVPVPIHQSRLNKRGYNQALLIAKGLSRLTGIPADNTLLARTRKTEAQKELGASGRRKNLMSAFSYVSNVKAPESVIIADDIFTTGSTVNALTHILRENGAKNVYVVCISIS